MPQRASYVVKWRELERRGGRWVWSKWIGARYGLQTEQEARDDMAQRDLHAPRTQFSIFYRGKRLPNKTNA